MEIEGIIDEFVKIYEALKERNLGLSERSLVSVSEVILRERIRESELKEEVES